MQNIFLCFSSEQTAEKNVAGVPLVARAILEIYIAAESLPKVPNIQIALMNGSIKSDWCLSEINRLAPNAYSSIIKLDTLQDNSENIFIIGEQLHKAKEIQLSWFSNQNEISDMKYSILKKLHEVSEYYKKTNSEDLLKTIKRFSRTIIKSTIKPTDGIVSRKINRPISMSISGLLLNSNHIRPVHATAVTALTAIIMFLCFIVGNQPTMIIGAILFQTASILDGVDGEIARATFRSSNFGASLDSLTDAATNLLFITGLGISLFLQGIHDAILMTCIGGVCLGMGMYLLGKHAVKSDNSVNFDGLKDIFHSSNIPFSSWLVWITMRDFLALLSTIMVILGAGMLFLQIFAAGSIIWLLIVIIKILHN